MSYLVLARKWRPKGFRDLTGQEPIVRVLTNSILQGKTAHAYIFSGPRGVGKTSTARILAKALNCENGPTPEPCGTCAFCSSITGGNSIDVIEIDGASNNSVEDVRDLRERVKYAPAGGRYKVYIIDETHMLSQSAFNALLKTLEEPPSHVVFVLATTSPSKIPLTVMSRCQHLPFRRIPLKLIRERLKQITESERIKISDSALGLIARAADGSMRDSLTILDQAASFSDAVEESDVKSLIGVSDFNSVSDAAGAVINGDRKLLLDVVNELIQRGTDLRVFTKDLIRFFRDLLVAKLLDDKAPNDRLEELLDASEEEFVVLSGISSKTPEEQLSLILTELIKTEPEVKNSFSPRVALEMALLRTSYLSSFKTVGEAIKTLKSFENAGSLHGTKTVPLPVEAASKAVDEPPESPEPPDETPPIQTVEDENPDKPAEPTGGALLKQIIEEISDWKVSSKLSKAKPDISGDTLVLAFNGSDEEICAKPLMEESGLIAGIASRILGTQIKVEITVRSFKAPRKKDLKEKALAEPAVKEALELFDGRVVDVRHIEEGG